MKSQKKLSKLLLISGPTCTGKTQIALKLASKFDGEIISADSRQIYTGLNIGTNKFGEKTTGWHYNKSKNCWFFKKIPIHLYDVIVPNNSFSVFDFVSNANLLIRDILAKGKLPIVVGGTGFYQRTLISPFSTLGIPTNPDLRKKLEKLATLKLVEKLTFLERSKAKTIDKNNRRRLIRAIEIALYHDQFKSYAKPKIDYLWIGLTAPKEFLYQKAMVWVKKVSSGQLQNETKRLIKKGYINTPSLKGIIYKETIEYLNGTLTFSDYQQELFRQLKSYIGRQLTWYKKQKEINWFDITGKSFAKQVEMRVETWLNK